MFVRHLNYRKELFPQLLEDLPSALQQTLRIVHAKNDGYSCDKFGDVLWFYRFKKTPIGKEEIADVQSFAKLCNCSQWFIREMFNRGTNPHLPDSIKDKEINNMNNNSWTALEGKSKYIFRTNSGWSPGLFLDQRQNRKWILENSKDKKVLNLFCYTAGFSLQAALGGCLESVSVDSSQQTLNWAKNNFSANNLNPENYEFWKSDALFFLQGCIKRQRKFDLIICDPPSFSRGKKNLFSIEKNAEELIKMMISLLEKDGVILFSSNFEKWSKNIFQKNISSWIGKSATVKSAFDPDKDFDFLNRSSKEPYLTKSFFISI